MHHDDSSMNPDFLRKLNREFLDARSNTPERSIEDEMRRVQEALGATGQYPEGKLTPEDEGEIKLAIGGKDGKVVLDFGKPVVWIGFSPAQARVIADTLNKWADREEKSNR